MLQVPTGLEDEPYTTSFKVAWEGPPLAGGEGVVTYRVVHQPSVSVPLSDGWYGTKVRGAVDRGRQFRVPGKLMSRLLGRAGLCT
jgi:hypothetical protein